MRPRRRTHLGDSRCRDWLQKQSYSRWNVPCRRHCAARTAALVWTLTADESFRIARPNSIDPLAPSLPRAPQIHARSAVFRAISPSMRERPFQIFLASSVDQFNLGSEGADEMADPQSETYPTPLDRRLERRDNCAVG